MLRVRGSKAQCVFEMIMVSSPLVRVVLVLVKEISVGFEARVKDI